MTEDQQPVWVESDGVSNLPPLQSVGLHRVRSKQWGNGCEWYAYFDGDHFYAAAGSEERAMSFYHDQQICEDDWNGTTRGLAENGCDAWWDYQGLMAKPRVLASPIVGLPMPIGDSVVYTWRIVNCEMPWFPDDAIMPSDEPGITAMQPNPAPARDQVTIGGLTVDMADLVEFLKAKQPKPEPNTTPRGILTVWNEGADHRLGMWQQTGNFAD